jgi:hypothetical protein
VEKRIMNTNNVAVINTRCGKVVAASLIALAGLFAASQASADRYRTVVVHETVRTSPGVVVHSGPVYVSPVYVSQSPAVYVPVAQVSVFQAPVTHLHGHQTTVIYGPGSHSSYITPGQQSVGTTTRTTTTRTTTTVRTQGASYGNVYHGSGHGYGHGHGHGGHTVISHTGNRHGYHAKHSPSRGNWSSSRRDVIHVDRKGTRNSSYRETEHRSVIIRDRSR